MEKVVAEASSGSGILRMLAADNMEKVHLSVEYTSDGNGPGLGVWVTPEWITQALEDMKEFNSSKVRCTVDPADFAEVNFDDGELHLWESQRSSAITLSKDSAEKLAGLLTRFANGDY